MEARRIRVDDRPARTRALRDGAGREREGRGGGFGQHSRSVFGDEGRGEEAHHAGGLERFQSQIIKGYHGERIARGDDHVVQLPAFREEAGDVALEAAGVAEVAGVAREAGFGGRVGFQERGDGGVDAGGLRGGEYDGGALFEDGFGGAVADPGRAADDEDAGGGELMGVFGRVSHSGYGIL